MQAARPTPKDKAPISAAGDGCSRQRLAYNSLPTPSSIRLLEVLPSPDGEISCALVTADLDDDPVFDALSYTWGNPVTIYEKPDEAPLMGDLEEILSEA